MYNFTKGRVPSVLRKLKYDLTTPDYHRKILIIGSGDSGYSILSAIRWLWNFQAQEVGLLTNQPIHRVSFGLPLFGMGYYLPIDFERPLLNDFKNNLLNFDEAISISPEENKLTLFNGDQLTYDYLILACGQTVDLKKVGGNFIEKCGEPYNNYYDMSNFEGYKKLMINLEFANQNEAFHFKIGENACHFSDAISLMLLIRRKFNKSEIKISFEKKSYFLTEKAEKDLFEFFDKKKIEVLTNQEIKFEIKNTDTEMSQENAENISQNYDLFYPSKYQPQFLQENESLLSNNFDTKTLINKSHSNVFGLGNYIFPDCSFFNKQKQTNVLINNLKNTIDKDWFEKECIMREYEHENAHFIFDNYAKVFKLGEKGLESAFLSSKIRAWNLLNSEIFRHLYWNRLRPKHLKSTQTY